MEIEAGSEPGCRYKAESPGVVEFGAVLDATSMGRLATSYTLDIITPHHIQTHLSRPNVALLTAMGLNSQTGLDDLPAELVEKIAYQLPLATLKAFRLSESRCAAAGFKPLLGFVPNAINSSTLEQRGRASNRELSQLVDLTSIPPIARIVTSLTVGHGATRLELLSEIQLPSLACFRLKQIETTAAQDITTFLSNHAHTLQNLELDKVDIIRPLKEGNRNETLPTEWQNILTTIHGLPHVSDLLLSDLGYYNPNRDITYRIWIDPAQIRENESLRREDGSGCEVVIRAKGAQATARGAVGKVVMLCWGRWGGRC